MNKEALPLILALGIPLSIVLLLLFYFYGYDITVILRKIDLIYYIIIIPFGLGLLAALFYWKK